MSLETDVTYLKKQLNECIGEIGQLKMTRASSDLVAHHYIETCKRLERLESNQLGQSLDPKVWVFVNERLDKLESLSDFKKIEACVLDGAQTHFSVLKIENRLSELEEWTRKDEDIIYDKLKKLEEMQHDMLRMPNVVWAKYHKTPHKCPVCDGQGKLWPKDTIGYNRCEPCEGKGIVWG